MNGRRAPIVASSAYRIYPKRYFDLSRTWFEWNRLSAADIHALHDERGFEGQHIAFHLNHPICFVRVVGLVLEIELTGRGGRYALISLDDGSGACITAKIERREITAAGDSAQYPSNTLVDAIDVNIVYGCPRVFVNGEPIDVGTVLKVKARLDTFMGTRQLRPERVWIVKDTNAEAKAWAEVAAWKREHLAEPWVLSPAQMEVVDERVRQDAIREREAAKKKSAARAQYDKKRTRHEQKKEAKRRLEEENMNEGALPGSHILTMPWT